jgi:hypothetical protein
MKRIYRLFLLWFVLGIVVPFLICFSLHKFSHTQHGVRVRIGDQSWITPTFDEALTDIWQRKVQEPIDIESYIWIRPHENRYLIFKGPPRKFLVDTKVDDKLSHNFWTLSLQPLSPGLHEILIRFREIPLKSNKPQLIWTKSLVTAETITNERLFPKYQHQNVLTRLLIAKYCAIFARLNCVLIFLVPFCLGLRNLIRTWIPEPKRIVIAALLFMAALRFYGLTYQMQEGLNPDERVVERLTSLFRKDLKPQNYLYTPGFHYMNVVAEGLTEWVVGHEPPDHATSRVLSALFASLSCLIVLAIGYPVLPTAVAFIAMALFGFAFMPIQLAHFGIIEPTMVFFFLVGVRAIITLNKESDLNTYFLTGIACGLAVGIKQTAGIIFIPFLATHLFINRLESIKWPSIKKALIWVLGAAISCLLLTPYTVLDFPRFFHDQIFQLRGLSGETHVALYFVGATSGPARILAYINEGIGYPIFISAIIGCILIWRLSRKAFFTIVPFTIIFFTIASVVRAAPYHYPLLLCPFLALLAAVTVYEIGRRLRFSKAIMTILTIGLLIMPLTRVIKLERILSGVDTRRQASEWCYRSLPLGARVDYEEFGPRFLIPVFRGLMISLWSRGTWEQFVKFSDPTYIVIDSTTADLVTGRKEEEFHDENEWFEQLRKNGVVLKEFSGYSYDQYNPHVTIYQIPKQQH